MAHARTTQPILTARLAGLRGCRVCGKANPPEAAHCGRCGSWLKEPDLQAVWAWLAAGMVAYIPANLYPMMRTTSLGRTFDSTIIGGALDVAASGDWFVAIVILVASVAIPILKFMVIAYLAINVQIRQRMRGPRRLLLYEVVEFIGRWSMIDVFVVAILAALVQFDFAAAIKPGIAAASFALSVVFTMLAARCFDPRLLWRAEDGEPS